MLRSVGDEEIYGKRKKREKKMQNKFFQKRSGFFQGEKKKSSMIHCNSSTSPSAFFTLSPVLLSDFWHGSSSAGDVINNLVYFIILRVDGTDQHVVGDVLQVTTELEPGTGGGDVISGALSFYLDQDLFSE